MIPPTNKKILITNIKFMGTSKEKRGIEKFQLFPDFVLKEN